MDQILAAVRSFDGVLDLAPEEGSDFPEIAWGDHFFYHSPDGTVPERGQPFATIVTKDYPGEPSSDLDPDGRYRLNVHVDRDTYAGVPVTDDWTTPDVVVRHPVYPSWVSIVVPGPRTTDRALELLRAAHDKARGR